MCANMDLKGAWLGNQPTLLAGLDQPRRDPNLAAGTCVMLSSW